MYFVSFQGFPFKLAEIIIEADKNDVEMHRSSIADSGAYPVISSLIWQLRYPFGDKPVWESDAHRKMLMNIKKNVFNMCKKSDAVNEVLRKCHSRSPSIFGKKEEKRKNL